jgi:hypothetical protein
MKKPEAGPETVLEIISKPTIFRTIGSKIGYRR